MSQRMDNYPNGFSKGVLVKELPIVPAHGAKVFYVGNNASLLVGEKGASNTGNKGTFYEPFSTVVYALTQCVANRGDIIYVRPGYSEVISSADADFDVNGVTIVGLGYGTNRPTVTYTGTTDTTTVDISANNVRLFNFLFDFTDNDAVDDAMILNGTDCEIAYCEFRASAADQPDVFLTIGKADADSDRSYIHHNKFTSLTAGANSAISVDFDMTDLVIANNYIDGDWADAGLSIPTGGDACVGLIVDNNYIRNRQTGDHAVEIAAITSGVFSNNKLVADTADIIISPVANAVYLDNVGSLGNAATTGPAGGSFPVPAHMYGQKASMIVKNTDTVDSGVTYAVGTTTLFTVTGSVFARVWGHVTTAVTSTGDTGTITVGITGNTAKLVPSYTAGSGTIVAHDILGNAGTTAVPGDDIEGAGTWVYIGNGEDILATVATNNLTAGVIDWYCEWYPISANGRVVSA